MPQSRFCRNARLELDASVKTTSGAAGGAPLVQDWQDIVILSERMLEAAHSGNWSALFDLESRRSALIARAMPDAQQRPEGTVPEQLQKVLAFNGRLMQILHRQQASRAAELQRFGQGRRALEQYGKHQ